MRAKFNAAITLFFLALTFSAGAQDQAKVILQESLFAEEAEHNLEKAADGYNKLIADYDRQRDYAVAAIYRLAEVRRKQQRNDEAARLYQRILAEFPDAVPQARLSEENLSAMGIAADPAKRTPLTPLDPEEEKELRRLMMLAENSPERVWKENPLVAAAKNDWLRVEEWLLDNAAATKHDTSEELDLALNSAAESGNLDSCELLLARGANIASASKQLVVAILDNRDHIANWLVDNGADINHLASGNLYTIYGNPREFVRASSQPGRTAPSSCSCWLTPLAAAIAIDDKVWVDRLLDLGAAVEAVEEDSRSASISALSVACGKNHAPLVRRLLALGANPNSTDSLSQNYGYLLRRPQSYGHGWTPLHYGAGDPEIVAALLKAGAKPLAEDSLGLTPLHCACYLGNPESVRLLLEAGCDPAVTGGVQRASNYSKRELTPLMIASSYSDENAASAMVDLLVKHGADIHAKDPEGKDVFEYCRVAPNRTHLVRQFLYPDQAKKKGSISIAFPETLTFAELSSPEGDASAPPSFTELLLNWEADFELPIWKEPDTWSGFRWNRPTIHRLTNTGELISISVDIMQEGNFPSLRWGDIIEFTVTDTRHMGNEDKYSIKPTMPESIRESLRAEESYQFTLKIAGEEPRTLRARGGLSLPTPFGDVPLTNYSEILRPILAGGDRAWSSLRLTRLGDGDRKEILTDKDGAADAIPRDGDVLEVLSLTDLKTRADQIQLIEAGTKHQIYAVQVPEDAKPDLPETDARKTAKNLSNHPTLFQLIAEALQPFTTSDFNYISPDLVAEHREILSQRFIYPAHGYQVPDPPSQDQVLAALSAMARSKDTCRYTLPHPDFSTVRVRRLQEDGSEKQIVIPIREYIDSCTAGTPASECRARDIELQAGDIVEVGSHLDRLDQSWPGLDEAAARFLQKALTYDIVVKPETGPVTSGVVSWTAPEFFHTTAGTLAFEPYEYPKSVDAQVLYYTLERHTGSSRLPRQWARNGTELPAIVPSRNRPAKGRVSTSSRARPGIIIREKAPPQRIRKTPLPTVGSNRENS